VKNKCPKGYSMVKKGKKINCEKYIVGHICPKGYVLKGKDCQKIVKKKICPKGTNFNKESKDCVQIIEKPTKCPKGMVKDGEDCIKEKDAGCPEGQVKDLKSGQCKICKKGEEVRGGKCHKNAKPCEKLPNTIFQNGKCVPITRRCRSPLVLVKGRCISNITPTPTPTPTPNCKSDQVLNDGICEDKCKRDQKWDEKKKTCVNDWECYNVFDCQKRYKLWIKKTQVQFDVLSNMCKGKKGNKDPSIESKDPTRHVVKPSRRLQSIDSKKPTNKSTDVKCKITDVSISKMKRLNIQIKYLSEK